MTKLLDLAPAWIDWQDRRGIGITFRCMTGHCTGRQWILFANPLDGGAPWGGGCFQLMMDWYELNDREQHDGQVRDRPCRGPIWTRTGEDLATLSLSPSVNAHECGHLTLTNGEFR